MINESNFSASVLKALEILNKHNKDAYIVGGSIRDIIMGINPKDYDITTSALPEETLKIFSSFKTFKTGIRYGTVTVIIDGLPIEITTFRTDGEYKDNRKPQNVIFSRALDRDLSRRDFTINAMAYSPVKGFVDMFDGMGDIERKLIRAIGNPDERFSEDALRMLRALRFSSRLGFDIEENTKSAIFKNKKLLLNISAERIREEFNKILLGEYATEILSEYREIVKEFIPEISHSFDFEQKSKYHIYDVYNHTLKALEKAPKVLSIRLAVFFHDIAKPLCYTTDTKGDRHYKGHPELGADMAKSILKRLKYDNYTIKEVTTLIKYHDTHIVPRKNEIKKYLTLLGEELLEKLLTVKFADCSGKLNTNDKRYYDNLKTKEIMEQIIKNGECYSLKTLAICGSDLLNENIEGKYIGEILNATLNAVIKESLPNEKSVLLKYALDYFENIKN